MISAGRCNSNSVVGGGARNAAMSKDCRAVNGGYVNHCEQVLDGKNEVVMATSKNAGDEQTAAADRVLPASCAKVDGLTEFALSNLDLIDDFKKNLAERDEMIIQLSKDVKLVNQNFAETNKELTETKKQLTETKKQLTEIKKQLTEMAANKDSLDVLPFTPVSSTCSSGVGDRSTELHEQQDVRPKRRKNCAASVKPDPIPIELNQVKQLRTRSTRVKPNKMQELTLITTDNSYYTHLGNYDPAKDNSVSENSNSNLEIPSWRVKTFTSWYSMEGTENMSDDVYENRHARDELCERKRKRWDMQRLRELRRIEYLKEGRNKHHSQSTNENDKEELTTLLHNPINIKIIQITDKVPVSAFGCNLLVKKKLELYKFCHSQWCNDGTQIPQERSSRELRSSGRCQFYNNT